MRPGAWFRIVPVMLLAQGCGALIGIEDVPPETDAAVGSMGGSRGSGGSSPSAGAGGEQAGSVGTGGATTGGGGSGGAAGGAAGQGGEAGMQTGGAAGHPMPEAGPDGSAALLQFQVGTASPTPPNPDDYGTQGDTAKHHYTLKNVGGSETSPITTTVTTSVWEVFYEQGDCYQGSTQLMPGETCIVTVVFHAGPQTPGDFSATLTATATDGGKATNELKGKVARFWRAQDNGQLRPSATPGVTEGDIAGTPCGALGSLNQRQRFSVPNGIQVQVQCQYGAANCVGELDCQATNPTAVRQCGTTTTLGTFYEANFECFPTGSPGTFWFAPEDYKSACDTTMVNLIEEYSCL